MPPHWVTGPRNRAQQQKKKKKKKRIPWLLSGVVAYLCVRTTFSLPCVCVCVFLKKKKGMGNCPTLLKRVCCMYSITCPTLFKSYHGFWVELWCAFMLESLSLSLVCLCVCVCFSKKKKGNCLTLLKRVCCV